MGFTTTKLYIATAIDQMSAILDRPASAFVGCTLRQLFKAAEYQGAWVHWGEAKGMNLDVVITREDVASCSQSS